MNADVDAPGPPPHKGMVWIGGGSFQMGSERFYPEERPVHRASVDGFWIDAKSVTVAEFRRFVKATGYVTTAEIAPDPAAFPDADPDLLVPGSLVFTPPQGPVPLDDFRVWWSYLPGAQWRHPEGLGSDVGGRERHPVTHVSYADALAYCEWAGKVLPSESEWEFAARGGLDGKDYVWGDEHPPSARKFANVWEGRFPWENLSASGVARTVPVGSYRPNGYGLYDMAGNVWEWTCSPFTASHETRDAALEDDSAAQPSCCGPAAPLSREPGRRVIKGGSHLCAPNYCLRYRPAARQSETEDTSTCHVGFRCVVR